MNNQIENTSTINLHLEISNGSFHFLVASQQCVGYQMKRSLIVWKVVEQ